MTVETFFGELMKPKLSEIQIIGIGLAVLYLTTILIYTQSLFIPGFGIFALILILLFSFLFMASLGVVYSRQWGREWIVAGNAVAGGYLLILFIKFADVVPMSYVFMSIVVFLFFNQMSMRNRFATGLKIEWKSILVIDDDEGTVRTVRPALMTNGYAVLSAMTGEHGIQIAQVQQPDLILLDVILPGIKGRDVCKKLKADDKTRRIPVVFLTSKDSPDDIQAEKEAGGIAHLTKPVNIKELLAIIKDIIGLGIPEKEG